MTTLPAAADGSPAAAGEAVLSVRGLTTQFPTPAGLLRAVQDLSLEVMAGECVGIVGESGSGKSVAFASVMGLIRPPGEVVAGEVWFAGQDLRRLPPEALRRIRGKQIALTLQDALTALNPSLTVGQQLAEVIVAHDDAVAGRPRHQRARLARERAVQIMSLVGIPEAATRLRDYPHQFSGGMRQRMMIAIALACRPRLLIADEPTTALDVTIQAQVLELIGALRRDLGMSVVLITHDLGVVAEQCDRVYVMYAGQVVESGPVAEVIGDPRHPYTLGLLRATPRVEDLAAPVLPIPGMVPSLVNLPDECRFHARCAVRRDDCRAAIALQALPDGRHVRCVRALSSAEAAA